MHAALSWFVSHVLGGLVTTILVGGAHLVLTRRDARKVTDRQTAHIDAKTDAQTRELKGTPGGDRDA